MRTPHSTASRLAALAGVSAVILTAGAFPADAASSGDVDVINTETVQAYTDATGKVQSKRIYEQLALTGEGTVDLANPVTTDGLRNLNGFSGFDVKDGDQMVDVKVDGQKDLRSVSSYKKDLPLDISVVYKLDGKEITPKSLVGKSGDLEATYTVKNVTGRTETISFTDGKGGTVEKEAEVILPMVGSLSTGLPSNFRKVRSTGANMAGDGEGGTKLSFTMTLLAPLGADTATFGWTAQVKDAFAPDASVTALPVNPLESPSFKTAGDSYKAGASTGDELAAGAAKIDSNLLKLRDGAGDLLAGLIKLRNGAQQLSDGLNDEAAPGADKLADGTGQLRDGTDDLQDGAGKLDDGANQLNDGAGRLSGGLGDLKAGTTKLDAGATKLNDGAGRLSAGALKAKAGADSLEDGLAQISEGLKSLSGAQGLQAAGAGVAALQVGVQQIIAGFGAAGTDLTLIDGLTKLAAGLGQLETGQTQLKGGLDQLVAPTGLPAAKGGVDAVKAGLDDSLKAGGSLDQLLGGLAGIKAGYCPQIADPTQAGACAATVDALSAGVNTSKTNLGAASAGLGQVSGGLSSAIGGLNTQLIPGAQQILTGLTSAKTGANQALGGAQQLKAGAQQVSAGLTQLSTGLTAAIDGALKLSAGADQAYGGSSQLSTGLGDLSDGAGQLAAGTGDLKAGTSELSDGAVRLAAGGRLLRDGTGRLATGTGDLVDGAAKLGDGAGQLDDGANKLADGLSTAAGGSSQIADGLVQAAGGAPKIVDGAGRLSTEGTSKLVTAGQDTAQKYGEQYALMVAGAKRGQNEKMVVGAPADAAGLAAYSYEIKGENGEGNRNLMRGIAGLALLGAGGAVFGLRRRLI